MKPYGKMLTAVEAMATCYDEGRFEELAQHRAEYRRAAGYFLAAVRKELGVRT